MKIRRILLVLIIGIFSFCSVGADYYEGKYYNEVFDSIKLRHGQDYWFGDIFVAGSYDAGISLVTPTWYDPEDLNAGANPGLGFVQEFADMEHIVRAGKEELVVATEFNYFVDKYPEVRKENNLSIVYNTTYYEHIGDNWELQPVHTEFQPYEITRCGDGIRDNYYDVYDKKQITEECDGTQGINPATQTCSETCTIINNPVPVCNSISPSNVAGGALGTNGSFTTTPITCNVSNAAGADIKVNCGNGTTVNNGQACTYTTVGSFSASCMINGQSTGNQCSTAGSINVTTPSNPSYTIAKVDYNSNDNDGEIGDIGRNDTSRDSQTLNVGDNAVFRIYVRNTGNVTLTNLRVTDPLVPDCNRVIPTLAAGASYPAYTCTKTNTQRSDFPNGKNTVYLNSNELPQVSNPSTVVFEQPNCTGLTLSSSNGGTAPSNSRFRCNGDNHTNFTVRYSRNGSVVRTFTTNQYPGGSYSDVYSGLGAGNYTVTCTVDNQPLQAACEADFRLVDPLQPSIRIDKTAIDGTENQTVNSGGRAEFKIVVRNDGETNLSGPFNLNDPKVTSGNCTGVVRLPSDVKNTFSNFRVFGGTGSNNDNILQVGESFEYTCYQDNVVETTFNGINTISVSAPTVPTVTDPTNVQVLPAPVCNNLTIAETTRVVPFNSGRIICSGNSNTSSDYTIIITKNGEVIKTVNSKETTYRFTDVANYEVTCSLSSNGNTSNTCKLPVVTNAGTVPAIALIKTDYNASIDSDDREDYQEIPTGESAVFKITVRNDGNEDLKELSLTDTTNISVDGATNQTSVCGGTVNLTTKKLSSGLDIVYTGTGPNLKVGESFYYVCTLDNTAEGYTNTANVTAKSTVDGESVDDNDPSHVIVGKYDLALVKKVLDAESVFQKDGIVEYQIIVQNQGTIDAKGVVVTDYIPAGMVIAEGQTSWTVVGNKATRNIGDLDAGVSKPVTIAMKITASEGEITNWAEITSTTDGNDDCDSEPNSDQSDDIYTTDFANGTNPEVNPSGCNEGGDEDDHDPATISVGTYDLALKKTVVDLKSEYLPGDSVTFNIEVTNQGNVPATNVVVTDYIPTGLVLDNSDNLWTLVGDKASRVVGNVAVGTPKSVQITFTVSEGNTGTIINTAEISSDDGMDCDSTADNVNGNTTGEEAANIVDDAIGDGCNSGGDEDDHDIASITVGANEGEYDLALRKTLSDTTKTYEVGDSVTFDIEIINQGSKSVSNIEITDYIPAGLTLNDSDWTMSGSNAVHTIAETIAGNTNKTIQITFTIDAGTTGTIINTAEISEDNVADCDSTADNSNINDGTVTDNAVGNECESGGDEDDHDIASVTIGNTGTEGEYDLALRKTISGSETGYEVGDSVTFDIEIMNQGSKSVSNIEITDYIPAGLTLNDSDWTMSGSNAVRTIAETIAGNTNKTIQITFTIDAGTTGTIINTAEISEDNVTDCDSTADSIKNNDGTVTDNAVGNECESGGDEDDHDIASLTMKATPTGCTGSCGNSSSGPQCYNIEQSGNEYTCTVNRKAKTVAIDCYKDGTISFSKAPTKNPLTGRYEAKFTCNPKTLLDGTVVQATPSCNVTAASSWNVGQAIGLTKNQCRITGLAGVCGDGKVDKATEQCDNGNATYFPGRPADELNGGSKSSCTSTCKLKGREPSGPTVDDCSVTAYAEAHPYQCGISTYPTGGHLTFTALSNFAIGTQDVFEYQTDKYGFTAGNHAGKYVQVKNDGTEAIFLDDTLCIVDKGSLVDSTNTSIIGTTASDVFCESHTIDWVYPGETRYLRTPGLVMKGNPDFLSTGYKSETNKLVLTVRDGDPASSTYGQTLEWSPILSGDMYITVAKPGIANRGGGQAYIHNATDTSSISNIVDSVNDHGPTAIANTNQQNFVATVLGDGSDLSEVVTVADSNIINEVIAEGTAIETASAIVDTSTIVASTNFASYKGLSNVFAKKGGISLSTVPTLGGDVSKTFIIEGGDLTITSDIASLKNVAFIVKGGDIIIDPNVENIKGTYVNIGGDIRSLPSNKQLTIDGSLHGDISQLTANRTNISMDSNGNINVGTVISYGSNLLNKPAPLVGQFINESLEAQQIAQ